MDGDGDEDAGLEPAEYELVPQEHAQRARSGDRRAWFVAAVVLVVVAMAGAAITVVSRDASSGNAAAAPLSLFRSPNSTSVGAAIGPDASMYGPSPVQYHHDGRWPDLGSSGTVYRLGPVDLSEAQVAKMSSALDMQSAPARQPDGWMVDDGAHLLQVHATESGATVVYSPWHQSVCESDAATCGPVAESGSSSSSSSGSGSTGPATTSRSTDTTVAGDTTSTLAQSPPRFVAAPSDLPDEQAAQDLARDLLDRMGVLGGDWKATVVDAMMMYACTGSSDPNGPPPCPTDPIVVSRRVTFTRVVDGWPAEGLAWSVDVGDGGAISSLYGLTATVEEVANYPLITPAAAYDEIVNGDPFVAGPQAGTATSREFAAVGSAVDDQVSPSAPMTAPPDAVPETTPPDPGSTRPGGPNAPTTTITGPPGAEVPETTIPPEYVPGPPTVIQVTGVERVLSVIAGSENGKPVAYLVPSYHFTGSYDRADQYYPGANDWSLSVVAVDRSLVQPFIPGPDAPPATYAPGNPVPQPAPQPASSSEPGG